MMKIQMMEIFPEMICLATSNSFLLSFVNLSFSVGTMWRGKLFFRFLLNSLISSSLFYSTYYSSWISLVLESFDSDFYSSRFFFLNLVKNVPQLAYFFILIIYRFLFLRICNHYAFLCHQFPVPSGGCSLWVHFIFRLGQLRWIRAETTHLSSCIHSLIKEINIFLGIIVSFLGL